MLTIFHTQDKDLQLLQNSWSTAINPLLANPLMQGLILPNVNLINGATVINHLLGRNLQGWFLIDQTEPATVYRSATLNNKTLTLTSNMQTRVSIYVF